jgi:hypothetical protein
MSEGLLARVQAAGVSRARARVRANEARAQFVF